jgi:cytochrome c oxidase subunit III
MSAAPQATSQPYSAVDVSRMPAYGGSSDMPLWWGMIGLIVVESTVFSGLIGSYFYLGFGQPQWPLAGVKAPDLLMPSTGTALLLLSSLFMHWADKAVDRDDSRALVRNLLASIVAAAIFLTLKVIEYSDKDYSWDSHSYGSIVWLIIGFHSAHVLSVVLKTIIVTILARREFFHSENRLAITVNGIYWHFVVVVWIPLFAVLYISPRLS